MYPHRHSSTPRHLTHDGIVIGRLVAETPHIYRLSILDHRFALLDGSHFFSADAATSAVSRLARFVASPQHGNDAARRKKDFRDGERFFIESGQPLKEALINCR